MAVVLLEILDEEGDVWLQRCYDSTKAALKDLTEIQHVSSWYPQYGSYALYNLNRIMFKEY